MVIDMIRQFLSKYFSKESTNRVDFTDIKII